jgi:hypothetical protein
MPKAAAEKGSKKETKAKGAKKAKVGSIISIKSQHGCMGGRLPSSYAQARHLLMVRATCWGRFLLTHNVWRDGFESP